MPPLTLDDFEQDPPTRPLIQASQASTDFSTEDLIDGVTLTSLSLGADKRGQLNELLTMRDGGHDPIVHVYQVQAAPGSLRAWLYHKIQMDRLAFTNGSFRVVLYDLRPDSKTYRKLNVFDLGDERRCRLHIPPLVIHGVQNIGSTYANFVNMPTAIYYPDRPDKYRLRPDHPEIPHQFANVTSA